MDGLYSNSTKDSKDRTMIYRAIFADVYLPIFFGGCYHTGVSENSVPLNPMVIDHYPVFKWLFHWEYTLFSDKPIY